MEGHGIFAPSFLQHDYGLFNLTPCQTFVSVPFLIIGMALKGTIPFKIIIPAIYSSSVQVSNIFILFRFHSKRRGSSPRRSALRWKGMAQGVRATLRAALACSRPQSTPLGYLSLTNLVHQEAVHQFFPLTLTYFVYFCPDKPF